MHDTPGSIDYIPQLAELPSDIFINAFTYSGIGMALVGLDGGWLKVNNALCKILGYSSKELLAMNFQEITYAEDIAVDLRLVKKMLRKEIETYELEKRYISKDRKIVWAILNVSLVWNNDGTPKFFISQIVDITSKKELSLQLKEKNVLLESTYLELQQKIAQLEELNHLIAHNLRGPAGNIKMFIESYENNDQLFSFDETIKFVRESSESLVQSLDVLMEISQLKLDKHVRREACNIEALVDRIKRQLQATISGKNAKIELFSCEAPVQYPGVYLESILYNLISNALKYSRKEVAPHISISLITEGNKQFLLVKDNGLGIDLTKYSDKIFKLNQTFHPGFNGKGLGLYLTKSQIESMGGSITLISEVDKGTEFRILLSEG